MPAAARAKELPGITLSLEERIRVGFSRRMLMNAPRRNPPDSVAKTGAAGPSCEN